ncbi:beta strand repeat-containing protein, partial [Paenibacillus sp. PL2-23]
MKRNKKPYWRKSLSIMLTMLLISTYWPHYSVQAAPASDLVSFTHDYDFAGSTVTAGQGGSTAIPGITLQITSGDGYNWSYETPYAPASGIAASYLNSASSNLIAIKSADPAINFDFRSIFISDYGGSAIQVTGYDNGAPTGTVQLDTTQNGWQNTFNKSNGLTSSFFENVDEIRIAPQANQEMWIAINNIEIGKPVVTFDSYYSGTYVSLVNGAPKAADQGLTALDIKGYDFTVYSSNDAEDVDIGIEPFTAETPLLYASSQNGVTNLTHVDVSRHDGRAFNLYVVDITIDGVNEAGSAPVELIGYRNGNPVPGAILSQTISNASNPNVTLTSFDVSSNSHFIGIDAFRILPNDSYTLSGAIGIDNLLAVASEALAPHIDAHPSNSAIAAGENTTFTVTASYATGYQWQVDTGSGYTNITNGAPYSGATTSTLTITGATSAMNGYMYRAVVTGAATPDATSNGATLTVNSPPAITSHPSNSTIAVGENTTFTVTASYATSYQWQVNTGSGYTNITNGAPYSGATTSTLTITGATSAMNGYMYRAVVTGAATPDATSNGAVLTVNSPPAITSHPSNSTIAAGENTTFTVTASYATGYQWQVDTGSGYTNITNGAPYSGATTTTLTITGATSAMNGYMYRAVVTGAATPEATSNGAALTVNSPPAITSHPSNSAIAAGENTTFTVTASYATGYQWQVNTGSGYTNITNGAPYSGATTSTLTITGATSAMNGYMYRAVVTGAATPDATSNEAALTVNSPPAITSHPSNSTIVAGENTTFTVTASYAMDYQWQVNTGSGYTNITNGALYSGATTSTLSITGATSAMNGYMYRAVVTGAATPDATSNGAALTVNSPPAITSHPSNSTIVAGENT